ncbi:MAG: hypothetical protein M0041_01625 [Nitrospiraceae bacterium]|nr:hypothetical protein [Nitrospiraceae bacterium]
MSVEIFSSLSPLQSLLDRPIAFHRCFVRLGIGITGAVMLSQAVYWSKRTSESDGWFYKTIEEWEEETGLTRREQETARKNLKGILDSELKGIPARLHFRINWSALEKTLNDNSLAESAKQGFTNPPNKNVGTRQTGLAESAKQVCANPPNKISQISQAGLAESAKHYTEITTETTSEITPEISNTARKREEGPSTPPPERPNPPETPPAEGVYSKEFETFWAAYPKKIGKLAAWQAWEKMSGQRPPLEAILRTLDGYRQTEQWQETRFIPHPSNWLAQRRFDDEPMTGGSHGRQKPLTSQEIARRRFMQLGEPGADADREGLPDPDVVDLGS